MRFAARAEFDREGSAYGQALAEARRRGGLLDLTLSNPTRAGFAFEDALLEPLRDTRALQYEPDALGMLSTREAVAGMYRSRYGAVVDPQHLLLTASTSEAYSYLFRLFCEPGDAVLVPSPSYPLFDLLARLHDVELIPYPLVYHDGWQIDPAVLMAAVTPRTRAIITIHPNNPTGHYCDENDREALLHCAELQGLPLIVDEVFLDYPAQPGSVRSFASETWAARQSASRVLTFVLGGLSKLLCMPQMKVAWTAVCGDAEVVADVMHRLEIIADTFLSVGTPPQLALPVWLAQCDGIHAQVLQRVRENLLWLDSALGGTSVSRLQVEGGWTVVLRVPANDADVDFAVHLLQERGVALHPGSFYGFSPRGWLVASTLTPHDVFQRGVEQLLAAV